MEEYVDRLIKFIAKHNVFDDGRYPELKGATKEETMHFAMKHLALHFSKTAGKIAAVSEAMDHGKGIDTEELKKNIPKALINTLWLAGIVGMTGKDIIQAVETKYSDKL